MINQRWVCNEATQAVCVTKFDQSECVIFLQFLPSRTSLLGGEAVENFVFLRVRVLFYAVQILFKVRGIIWLSAGYVIFRVEEFVRVCSRTVIIFIL